MCGVIAVSGFRDVIQDLYDGLIMLQHRGQDAAGIITYNSQFHLKKANGLVRDVFHAKSIERLRGPMGIGHVRYPTAGCSSEFEAQPFFISTPFGIGLAHNGNLTNSPELRKRLIERDYRHLNTNSDSEILLNVFSVALRNQKPKGKLSPDDIFGAVSNVFRQCKGAYSAVALVGGQGIVGFRDPHGIRPLQLGKRKYGMKEEYIIASENTAFRGLDFEFVRDISPGEAVFIDSKNRLHTKQIRKGFLNPCIFEWVYLAAPDSTIDGVNVYKARIRMGEYLAKQVKESGIKIDTVIPVPETGRPMAAGLADKLKIRYREGLIRNRYITRTFIMPGQDIRKRSLHFKLHPIELEFKNKNVLLVDDSIVRGNTSKKIVALVREAGAKKVYFASTAPPIVCPDPYGIDLPTKEELIAANLSPKEISKHIGADWVFYGKIEDLHKAVQYGNKNILKFSEGCFTCKYPTPEVDSKLLKSIGFSRNKTRDRFVHDLDDDATRSMTLV